jgi:DNA-directed RNA polymerase subunit RPC12/RpoP
MPKRVTYYCSACGKNITGHLAAGSVIDRCPVCGVLLPKHQIEEGTSVSRGQLLGVAIGLTVSSIFFLHRLSPVPFIWLAWAYLRYRPPLRQWRQIRPWFRARIRRELERPKQAPISKSLLLWKSVWVFVGVYIVCCIWLLVSIVILTDLMNVGNTTLRAIIRQPFGQLLFLCLPALLSLYVARRYYLNGGYLF